MAIDFDAFLSGQVDVASGYKDAPNWRGREFVKDSLNKHESLDGDEDGGDMEKIC